MADDQAALAAPLAPFGGQVPPAPAWFEAAVAQTPERSALAVEGADIELLTWGRVGKPGLLFLHGNGAHADWWSFIAPFFATACTALKTPTLAVNLTLTSAARGRMHSSPKSNKRNPTLFFQVQQA